MPPRPRTTIRKLERRGVADFDEQLWPINVAMLILAGCAVGVISATSDFAAHQWYANGWVHLGVVAVLLVVLVWSIVHLENRTLRRVQLCILLSLIFHLGLAFLLHERDMVFVAVRDDERAREAAEEPPPLTVPDYQWTPLEQTEPVEEPFAVPVETQTPAPSTSEPLARPPLPREEVRAAQPLEPQPSEPREPDPAELSRAELAAPRRADEFAGGPISRQEWERRLSADVPVDMPAAPAQAQAAPSAPDAAAAAPERQAAAPDYRAPTAQSPAMAPQTPSAAELARRAERADAAPSVAAAPLPTRRAERSAELARSEAFMPEPGRTAAASPAATLDARTPGMARQAALPEVRPQPATLPGAGPSAVAQAAARQRRNDDRPALAIPGRSPLARREFAPAVPSSALAQPAPGPSAAATAGDTAAGPGSALEARAVAGVARAETGLALSARSSGGDAAGGGSGDLVPRLTPSRGVGDAVPNLSASTAPQRIGRTAAVAVVPRSGIVDAPLPPVVSGGNGDADVPAAALAGLEPRTGAAGGGRPAESLPGDLVPSGAIGSAPTRGPTATTPGIASGPRRFAPGAADVVGPAPTTTGTLRKAAPPGIAAAAVATMEAGPSAAVPGAPGAGVELADVADIGVPGRREAELPVQVAAAPGPGGLSAGSAPVLGVPNRRARPESEIVHNLPGRFLIERSGSLAPLDGKMREPVPAFRQRDPERRGRVAEGRGGSEATERAVELGLEYFARQQFADGHWALDRFPGPTPREDAQVAPGEMNSDTAATGLALLSFLGAGYTHRDDKYRDQVRKGLAWLLANQQPTGEMFRRDTDQTRYARSYAHGIATIALCEAYGMTRDANLREPARRAIAYIVAAQHPQWGGWRYTPRDDGTPWVRESDTSVSGWQLMALKSAQMAGLEVPRETLAGVAHWLDQAEAETAGRYRYNPYAADTDEQRQGRVPNLAMTAEALLMRMYLGARRGDAEMIAGADVIEQNLPEVGTAADSLRDCYYWYYATQVMFQMQGDHWKVWNDRLRPLLETSQVTSGPLAGSWHPDRPVRDRWAHAGGRHYVTAMHLLMLEVYYRHLPLYGIMAE